MTLVMGAQIVTLSPQLVILSLSKGAPSEVEAKQQR